MSTKLGELQLASKEFVAGDKLGRAIFAFLKGESIDDIKIVTQPLIDNTDTSPIFLSKIRTIVSENSSEFNEERIKILDKLERMLKKEGLIVILSGPSAVGKDQIAVDLIDELVSRDIKADYLHKYGTRIEKPGERLIDGAHFDSATYYSSKTEVQMNNDPDIFFKYPKYDYLYGFSKRSLENSKNMDVLLIIFGAINLFPQFLELMQSISNRMILSVLLTAEEDVLYNRQKTRKFFTPDEMLIRTDEMRKDLKTIKDRPEIIELYDYYLSNGKQINIGKTESIILDAIEQMLTYKTLAVKTIQFQCTTHNCTARLRAPEYLKGKKIQCPGCCRSIIVPNQIENESMLIKAS